MPYFAPELGSVCDSQELTPNKIAINQMAYRGRDASRPPAGRATERWAPPPQERFHLSKNEHRVLVLNARQCGLGFWPARTWLCCDCAVRFMKSRSSHAQPLWPPGKDASAKQTCPTLLCHGRPFPNLSCWRSRLAIRTRACI